jgi:hypothetical protein
VGLSWAMVSFIRSSPGRVAPVILSSSGFGIAL